MIDLITQQEWNSDDEILMRVKTFGWNAEQCAAKVSVAENGWTQIDVRATPAFIRFLRERRLECNGLRWTRSTAGQRDNLAKRGEAKALRWGIEMTPPE